MLAVIAIVGSGFAKARAEPRKAGNPAGQEMGLREAKGTVKDVDKGKSQVTLGPSRGEPLILQVDRTTTIFIDGRVGRLDEVKPGTEVRAAYETRRGANRAQWIEVNRREGKSPPEQPLPEAPAPSAVPR